jgi:mevalonate kinase
MKLLQGAWPVAKKIVGSAAMTTCHHVRGAQEEEEETTLLHPLLLQVLSCHDNLPLCKKGSGGGRGDCGCGGDAADTSTNIHKKLTYSNKRKLFRNLWWLYGGMVVNEHELFRT